jgi:hypothetical protein
MKSNVKLYRKIITVIGIALLAEGITRSSRADVLYVGDGFDNTVKAFNANTGKYTGIFVTPESGGLIGPRGLIFSPQPRPTLLVANQNVNQPFAGEILAYHGVTGKFLKALVPHTDPNAPFAPRGIVAQGILYVASFTHDTDDVENADGSILMYMLNGEFLGELPKPQAPPQLPTPLDTPGHFHPRSLVILDDFLYVSNAPNLPPQVPNGNLQGEVLRYDLTTKALKDVFVSDVQGYVQTPTGPVSFNRPEGLVFGPDGNLYVTSFRRDPNDTDKILIFAGPGSTNPPPGSCIGKIDLELVGQTQDYYPQNQMKRAAPQALLFGPGGRLYVPITGPPDSLYLGEVRSYDVAAKAYTVFVPDFAHGGPMGSPWYLTFGRTDPATLAYPTK